MASYYVREIIEGLSFPVMYCNHIIKNTNINNISDEIKKAGRLQYHGTMYNLNKFCINNELEDIILINKENEEYNIDKLFTLNQIKRLSFFQIKNPPNLFHYLGNLTNLKLEFCNLTEIPKSIFDLKELNILVLSDNEITKIPKEIIKLKKLAALILSDNKIDELPEWILTSMPKLYELYIQNNKIKYFPAKLTYPVKNKLLAINDQLFTDHNIIDNTKYYKTYNYKKYLYFNYYNLDNNINYLSDKCIRCNKSYSYLYRVSFISFKYTPEQLLFTQLIKSKKQYLWQEYVYMCRKCKDKNKITEFVY